MSMETSYIFSSRSLRVVFFFLRHLLFGWQVSLWIGHPNESLFASHLSSRGAQTRYLPKQELARGTPTEWKSLKPQWSRGDA